MEHAATSYIDTLSTALKRTEVTNAYGESLSLDQGIDRAVQMLLTVGQIEGKVLLIGNGGSAAIVSHVQNDLCKGASLRAMVFTEQPLLTALSNDLGYETVYERPIELWGNRDDVVVAVSSSGRSENILRAVHAATLLGCHIITFSGFAPSNPLRRMGEVNFYVPAQAYGCVEVAHMTLTHCLVERVMEEGLKTAH